MHLSRHALFLISVCITSAFADFLGPTYPAPHDLTSNKSLIPASWDKFTSTLDAYLKKNQSTASGSLSGVENVTFSIGLFSIHDPAAAKLQYHYTSPQIANATQGATKVDGDSIYRVASISKLFTVFAGLLELTEEDWNRPLIEIIPELADPARVTAGKEDPVYTIQWDKITPWALAAHLAGIPPLAIDDILSVYESGLSTVNPAITLGFPPLDSSRLGPCWDSKNDSTSEYIVSIRCTPPVFLPWTSPAYSDDGYMLLGVAISRITGKPIATIYRESIFKPLGMTSSNSSHPTGKAERARSVITDETNFLGADTTPENEIAIPSGGLLSTVNDLAKFGVGILNSTLFPADLTRKWMKPITHTPSLSYSIGAAWEIIRYIHPSTSKVTDIYTKIGDSGHYGGVLALIPDYNAGFSILAGSTSARRSNVTFTVLDYLTEELLPALEAQAAAEAESNFVGTYVSIDSNLNSSVTVSFNKSTVQGASSGLSISSWISNGTDVLGTGVISSVVDATGMRPRLLPSIPNQSEGAGKVAFQASTYLQTNTYTAAGRGPFMGVYWTNFDWLVAGQTQYGGYEVNLFVFDVDVRGNATTVRPAVTRATLMRKP